MSLSLTELKEKTPTQLADFARELKLQNVTRMRRQDQIFSILKTQAKRGEKIKGEGVVEILQEYLLEDFYQTSFLHQIMKKSFYNEDIQHKYLLIFLIL